VSMQDADTASRRIVQKIVHSHLASIASRYYAATEDRREMPIPSSSYVGIEIRSGESRRGRSALRPRPRKLGRKPPESSHDRRNIRALGERSHTCVAGRIFPSMRYPSAIIARSTDHCRGSAVIVTSRAILTCVCYAPFA